MGAVAAEDEVVGIQAVSHADGSGLLSGGQVGGTGVVVGDAVVAARGLDEIEHRLELADGEHVAVDMEEVFLGEVAFLELVLDRLLILHHRNFRELDLMFGRTADLIGVDVN